MIACAEQATANTVLIATERWRLFWRGENEWLLLMHSCDAAAVRWRAIQRGGGALDGRLPTLQAGSDCVTPLTAGRSPCYNHRWRRLLLRRDFSSRSVWRRSMRGSVSSSHRLRSAGRQAQIRRPLLADHSRCPPADHTGRLKRRVKATSRLADFGIKCALLEHAHITGSEQPTWFPLVEQNGY